LSQPRRFLEALFAGKPGDLHILLWTLPEKESRWFRAVNEAIRCAESLSARDLYVGIGLATHDHGPKQRCKSEEIAGIVGMWADLDLRSDAHRKAALPANLDQALSILPPEFPPSIVVLTGNGAHVWWLFREPWIFVSAEDRREAATLVSRWHTLLRDNASQRGWAYERLADLARVLRVPGTMNCKGSANPKPVVIHGHGDARYNPPDFADYLDDLGVSDEEGAASAARDWGERFKDTPIGINLAARIPEEKLNRWLETDLRFKNTWFRQRHDLNDQSQSGYDLALCNFGFSNGLTEQQIVDLLVQHRTLHKQKYRTRVDYFQRTLAKAARASDETPLRSERLDDSLPHSSCADNTPAGPTDPSGVARSKPSICRRVSIAFGIEVLRFVKISGEQPIYRMETADGKIGFDNVGKFISQQAVRTAIAATAGKLIRRFKPKEWEEIARSMLDACIVEEGGEEMQQEGAARIQIGQYLVDTAFIASIEGQMTQNFRKPMVRGSRITVCSSDIQMFISKTPQQHISIQEVVAMLSAIGAKAIRVRGKKKEQSRWELPLDEFDPADYSVPEPDNAVDEHERTDR
jgi:hypothetical protein